MKHLNNIFGDANFSDVYDTFFLLKKLNLCSLAYFNFFQQLGELKLFAERQTTGKEVMSDSGHCSSISSTVTSEVSKIPGFL